MAIIREDNGDDTITDFGRGNDRIDLRAFPDITSIGDLSVAQQGDDVVVDLSGQDGGTILLSDFNMNDLNQADFLFSV